MGQTTGMILSEMDHARNFAAFSTSKFIGIFMNMKYIGITFSGIHWDPNEFQYQGTLEIQTQAFLQWMFKTKRWLISKRQNSASIRLFAVLLENPPKFIGQSFKYMFIFSVLLKDAGWLQKHNITLIWRIP